jgi:hypothetical protein
MRTIFLAACLVAIAFPARTAPIAENKVEQAINSYIMCLYGQVRKLAYSGCLNDREIVNTTYEACKIAERIMVDAVVNSNDPAAAARVKRLLSSKQDMGKALTDTRNGTRRRTSCMMQHPVF